MPWFDSCWPLWLWVCYLVSKHQLSDILPEEVEQQLKEFAEVSMGTDIGEDDMDNILQLADQVIEITDYRAQLFEYLKVSLEHLE